MPFTITLYWDFVSGLVTSVLRVVTVIFSTVKVLVLGSRDFIILEMDNGAVKVNYGMGHKQLFVNSDVLIYLVRFVYLPTKLYIGRGLIFW